MAKEIVVENIIKDEIVIEKNTKQQVQIENVKNDQVVVEEKNSSGTIINEDGARIVNNYDSLKNKPKINGKELEGDLSTEDLGIKVNVEVPTKTSELENDSNFVTKKYVDDEIAELDLIKELIVTYEINPATMEAGNLSHSSEEIIAAFNAGEKIYLNGLILGSATTICSTPEMIDGDYVFTYPLMRVNLGEGMQNYMFALEIYKKNITIKVNKLINDDDIQGIYDEVNEVMNWFVELIVDAVDKQAKESAAAEIAKIENRLLSLNAPENAIMKVINGEWTAVTETQEEENEV